MDNLVITKIGETEKLDSEGTYRVYYAVEEKDGCPIDTERLQEDARDAYSYRSRCAGAYFCDRVDVYAHPFLKYRAIIEATHSLDI